MRARPYRPPLVALLLAALTGCATVREIEKPLISTTLVVTRAGEAMRIQWTAESGVIYSLLYAERRDARAVWRVLPGAERIQGRGEAVVWSDRVPSGQSRYYRLQAVPAPARKP